MARFTFGDLRPAPATPELRTALGVAASEPLLARRLRGSGRSDRGRRAVEIVVPSRLPSNLPYRAGGLLTDNLDLEAPQFRYGGFGDADLRDAAHASQAVVLHDWQRYEGPEYRPEPAAPDRELPGLVLVSETEEEYFHPVAVQFFFDPPRLRDQLYQAVRRPYGLVRRAYLASRPGDQWWRNIGRF